MNVYNGDDDGNHDLLYTYDSAALFFVPCTILSCSDIMCYGIHVANNNLPANGLKFHVPSIRRTLARKHAHTCIHTTLKAQHIVGIGFLLVMK